MADVDICSLGNFLRLSWNIHQRCKQCIQLWSCFHHFTEIVWMWCCESNLRCELMRRYTSVYFYLSINLILRPWHSGDVSTFRFNQKSVQLEMVSHWSRTNSQTPHYWTTPPLSSFIFCNNLTSIHRAPNVRCLANIHPAHRETYNNQNVPKAKLMRWVRIMTYHAYGVWCIPCWELTYPGIPSQSTFEDDFPFPTVGAKVEGNVQKPQWNKLRASGTKICRVPSSVEQLVI